MFERVARAAVSAVDAPGAGIILRARTAVVTLTVGCMPALLRARVWLLRWRWWWRHGCWRHRRRERRHMGRDRRRRLREARAAITAVHAELAR